MTVSGINDERVITLRANQINQPIEVTGIQRLIAFGNYFNSTVSLNGYVRWSGIGNAWLGPLEIAQVTTAGGARFVDYIQRDASSNFGRWLTQGMALENVLTAGGYNHQACVRDGVLGSSFAIGGTYGVGEYVIPTTDNGYCYKVTIAGTAGAEPVWPTVVGNTVTSGGVTFQCLAVSALLKGMGPIQA
jgi:hypothetical protein